MWSLRAVGLLVYAAVVNAVYYIDDADSSVTYNSTAGVGYSTKWKKYSFKDSNLLALAVQESQLFQHTASYTQCYTDDDCTITIPFNGTGITLFVAQDVGDIYNVTVSLDGGPSTIHVAYQPNVKMEAYNLSLYDVQGLEWTTHTVKVGLAPEGKRLLFDYAAVTGDKPSGAVVTATVPL
ncbi:hypothetical protein C8J57DRAFT_1377544 [Mycena rebaudengoi]|nr:hypothetical protein C8J57DRAFT_1377544 [Mycena rebaudengoi]